MRRRVELGEGEAQRVAAACARAFSGVDTVTGERLGEPVLVERAGWLAGLVEELAGGLIAAHWNRPDLAQLASGRDRAGAVLPSQAWMALRRLGWAPVAPAGVYVPDRVVRIAQEQAGRALRSAWWRARITDALLTTWPADPQRRSEAEWAALRAVLPAGEVIAGGVLRARTQQITAFHAAHWRLPTDLTECERPPGAGRLAALAAVDRQLATLERCPEDPAHHAALTVRLPTRPDPASRADWRAVRLRFRLPPTVPAAAVLCPPSLRVRQGRLLLDVPYAVCAPKTAVSGHRVAVAFDWGLNTLLTGGTLTLTDEAQPRVLADARRPVVLRADGVLAKADRLRLHSERLHARIAALTTLIDSRRERGVASDPWVVAKLAVLEREAGHVAKRRIRLNEALARAAARLLTDTALAVKATVIYLEDLRDLEARGKGRTLNTRLSQTVRGAIVTHTRHRAAAHGIAVALVPPRGTSQHCPRCLTPFKHHHAPNDQTSGWAWATCPNTVCGYSTGRDHAAWQRIGARGLTHQTRTRLHRTTQTLVIHAVVEALEQASRVHHTLPDRTKSSPTRKRPRPGKRPRVPAPLGTPRAPMVRGVPGGQRPAGRPPTHPKHRSRRRTRQQEPTTIGLPATPVRPPQPHRPDGTRLGAGFHRHAHTTFIRRRPSQYFPRGSRTSGNAQETQADERR